MGIPGFFKWLSEQEKACILKAHVATRDESEFNSTPSLKDANPNGIEFGALFLDLNGLLHMACRSAKKKPHPWLLSDVLAQFFGSIFCVLRIVRPRYLIYFALDGVAPRAKLNQQRERRFSAIKESNNAPLSGPVDWDHFDFRMFDSNMITAGTDFMKKVSLALHDHVSKFLLQDLAFQRVKMIVSDSTVSGEGEHKLMDFFRKWKKSPDYDPQMRKVFYGADADLLMLSLSLHEDSLFILREDPNILQCPRCLQHGHLFWECTVKNTDLPESVRNNTTIHIAGFSPNIREHDLIHTFSQFGDIKEIRLPFNDNLEARGYAFIVYETFDSAHLAITSCHGMNFCGRKIKVSLSKEKKKAEIDRSSDKLQEFMSFTGVDDEQLALALLEESQWNVQTAVMIFFDPNSKPEDLQLQRDIMSISKLETSVNPSKEEEPSRSAPDFIFVDMGKVRQFLVKRMSPPKGEIDINQMIDDFIVLVFLGGNDFLPAIRVVDISKGGVTLLLSTYSQFRIYNPSITLNRKIQFPILSKFIQTLLSLKSERLPKDTPKKEITKEQNYYSRHFNFIDSDSISNLAFKFSEGLSWLSNYYFVSCPSWRWFYNYHYPPLAQDLAFVLEKFEEPKFELGKPFSDRQQLMAVLPLSSAIHCLPPNYVKAMETNLLKYCTPIKSQQIKGKKVQHPQKSILLPFIDEDLLIQIDLELNPSQNDPDSSDVIYLSKDHKL